MYRAGCVHLIEQRNEFSLCWWCSFQFGKRSILLNILDTSQYALLHYFLLLVLYEDVHFQNL